MKKVYVLLFCVCLAFFSACANESINNANSIYIDESENKYSIAEKTSETSSVFRDFTSQFYIWDDISIEYPQFTEKNGEEVTELNDLVKNEAMSILDKYNDAEGLNLDIIYEITYCGDNLVSIVFSGYSNITDSPYPNNEFYTINIDIKNMKKLKLSDYVNINEDFAELFKSNVFDVVNFEQIELQNEYTKEQLLEYLSTADTGPSTSKAFSYFTDTRIGISIVVLHILGDHAEYEADYQDIEVFLHKN